MFVNATAVSDDICVVDADTNPVRKGLLCCATRHLFMFGVALNA
jgi:hypothetical protein